MLRTSAVAGALGTALVLCPASFAQPVEPVGNDFQVNTFTTETQNTPALAVAGSGEFVVVWRAGYYAAYPDGDGFAILGQRFTADAALAGGEFLINTYTTSSQFNPGVTGTPDGDFVVVWQSVGSSGTDASYSSVQGQRYGSDGTAAGGEFQINSYTTDTQASPAVAAAADGGFVVTWQSGVFGAFGDNDYDVVARRFGADGTALATEFRVNAYTTGNHEDSQVVVATDGGFLVVWRSDVSAGTDTDSRSIQARRYASDGSPVAGQFQINTYTTGDQYRPAGALAADGDLMLVWQSNTGPSETEVRGRRYAAAGIPTGDDFQINVYTTDVQSSPSIAATSDGSFVVTFSSGSVIAGPDGDGYGIVARMYEVGGVPQGGEFQVNSYTTGYQAQSAIAADADGRFVVAWTSNGSSGTDVSGPSVQARRFNVGLFADSFESGEVSSWSASAPLPRHP